MVDAATKKTLSNLPLLKTKAGPRERDVWVTRLKEEYQALITVSIVYLESLYKCSSRLWFPWFLTLKKDLFLLG